jgi:hypothetical protein
MKGEMLSQIRARLAYQKELKSKSGEHSLEEHYQEMFKWVKISFAIGFPLCILGLIKDFVILDLHHGHEDEIKREYMKIRTKQYPWECDDCDLFDTKCWKACREEKAAAAAAAN